VVFKFGVWSPLTGYHPIGESARAVVIEDGTNCSSRRSEWFLVTSDKDDDEDAYVGKTHETEEVLGAKLATIAPHHIRQVHELTRAEH
jgi:hypothetical protein